MQQKYRDRFVSAEGLEVLENIFQRVLIIIVAKFLLFL